MSIAASIVGTYRLPSSLDPEKDEFMHVGGDGRIVHFIYPHPTATRLVTMSLWAEPLGEDRYRIRVKPGTEGWTVIMLPTETGMVIDREETTFQLTRAGEAELPEWYAEELAKALGRMLEREAQAKRR